MPPQIIADSRQPTDGTQKEHHEDEGDYTCNCNKCDSPRPLLPANANFMCLICLWDSISNYERTWANFQPVYRGHYYGGTPTQIYAEAMGKSLARGREEKAVVKVSYPC